MFNNKKLALLVVTIIALTITLSAISATDVNDTTDSQSLEKTVTQKATTGNLEKTNKETNTSTKTKKITKKEQTNTKTATKTVEVNNYNELKTAISNAVKDTDNDTIIINLNEGTYKSTASTTYNKGSATPLIIIEGNGQTLTSSGSSHYERFTNGCKVIFNNTKLEKMIQNYGSDIILNNSNITNKLNNRADLNMTLENSYINASISNAGTLIILENVILDDDVSITGDGKIITEDLTPILPHFSTYSGNYTLYNLNITKSKINYGNLTIINSNISEISNSGNLYIYNSTLNDPIRNGGNITISDDTTFGENFSINGGNIIINDTNRIINYITENYLGNYTLNNVIINNTRYNFKNLTLNNCTINNKLFNGNTFYPDTILILNNCTVNANISNTGCLVIDDLTIINESCNITDKGQIITSNITKILNQIESINGNYTLNNTILNKTYTYVGNITLNNCTITEPENTNYGNLYLKDGTINVGEENIFLINYGTVYLDQNTIITGKIENIGGEVITENIHKTYVITNNTLKYYFENDYLNSIINSGDTLDFQGRITPNNGVTGIIINKPVNIISSTNDGKLDNFTSMTYIQGASGSNVTGLSLFNTQFFVKNAHDILFNNISNIVNGSKIGWGVGQSSIRENSYNITVKNSYFYTRDNGGSSSLVLAWADNCTIINNTIIGGGGNGNLLYLTTYNVKIPDGIIANCNNQLINNTLIGEGAFTSIAIPIMLSGTNNTVDGNYINSERAGIGTQWGSGVDGIEVEESLVKIYSNTVKNNRLYGGGAIAVDGYIYNNYLEGNIFTKNSVVYNNIANYLTVGEGTSIITNNTISNGMQINSAVRNSSIIANNTINGTITIFPEATNSTLIGNNITGSITLDGSGNTITNNNITTTEEYTIESRRSCTDNVITDNYLLAAVNAGDDSVNLKDPSNIIENNIPINTLITVTAQSETRVNNTIPVTIILSTSKGKIIKGMEVTITTDTTETVTLENGVMIYQYTPTLIGEQTITVSFNGSGDYMASSNTTTITVTADKDAIIEELNNTVQEQASTIQDLNSTVNSQNKTIQDLQNNLTQANNQINALNNNITNLNNQVKTLTNENKQLKDNLTSANNKITAQEKQISDLNKSLVNANKALEEANKAIKDLNNTIKELNEQVSKLTTPADVKVTVNKITAVKYSDEVTITGTLTDKSGNAIKNTALTVTVNGKASNVATDSKGSYTLTAKATKVGTNNVTVQHVADDNYKAAKAASTFKVNKQDMKVTINSIAQVAYKENATITGILTDANGKGISNTNINITINGKTVKVKTTNGGLFTYSVKATVVGTNNVTVSYAGNNNYNKVSQKATFKVVKQDLIVTIDNINPVRFKENVTISGRFVDGNSKPIGNTLLTITINGKKYTAKTNAQGIYKLSVRVTQIDTNNVTVTYAGNNNYNKCTAKTTFKAIKQNLGITLDSVKTSNGKVTVSGTFTDEEGKPLMNSNVKVTINGKTYTAKTDNKGIYTLTKAYTGSDITLTLSYDGNKNYNSFSKTTKLTV